MKLWPFVVGVVGLVLAGTVYIWVREPQRSATLTAGRELPRLPVDRIEAPLPPRFSGPLPTEVEGFQQALEKGPPLSYVRARLLEGDREMGEKFLAALRRTADSARSFDELWSTYGVALGIGKPERDDLHEGQAPEDMTYLQEFQDGGVPCEWLRARLSERDEDPPLLRELFWRKLVRCPGAETEALFAREYAPVEWVLQHHSVFGYPRFTPALEQAVRRILAEDRLDLFTEAESDVSASQEPVARELRQELWLRASDELKAQWEKHAALWEQEKRRKREHPLKCSDIPTRPEGVEPLTVSQCLEKWAASNWAATARFAMSASQLPEFQEHADEFATLRNFPSLEAMKDWARERKLLPEATPTLEENPPGLYLAGIMLQAQQAFHVDLRTNVFPRRHDDLLVTLAWKARPELAGVVFEQIPPEHPPAFLGEKPSSEQYTLRAYADGHRFSVKAQNAYYLDDIGAVVGLLNQVLEARGSTHRFAVLDTVFWEVTVVFGSEAALREADARGLWRLGDGREVLAQTEARILTDIRRLVGEIPF